MDRATEALNPHLSSRAGILVLLFFVQWVRVAAGHAPIAPQESIPETKRLIAGLTSPLESEREDALQKLILRGAAAADEMAPLLRSRAARLRLGAARYFASLSKPRHWQDLVVAFKKEDDRVIVAALAAAIGVIGPPALAALDAPPAVSEDKMRLFVRVRVVQILEQVIKENTTSSGDFKGFYGGQFERLDYLKVAVDPVVEALASDESRTNIIRRAAVRALGTLEREDVGARLRRVRMRFLRANGLPDIEVTPIWRIEDRLLVRCIEEPVLRYIDYARARRGDAAGVARRIAYHQREKSGYERAMRRAPGDQAEAYRDAIAGEVFSIAYCHQQSKDLARATDHYLLIGRKFRSSVVARTAYYNLACLESLRSNIKGSLEYLKTAIEIGYQDAQWIHQDNDLLALRTDPGFEALMKEVGFSQSRDDSRQR